MNARDASINNKSARGDVGRLLQLGALSLESADHRAAAGHFRAALRDMTDTAAERPATLRKLSECLVKLGDVVEAQSVIQEAVHALGDDSAAQERVLIHLNLARVSARRGKYGAAGRAADTAIALLEGLEDTVEFGDAMLVKANVAHRQGQYDDAMRRYHSALRVYKSSGNLVMVGQVYRNIGMLHKNACNWSRALENYQVSYNLLSTEGSYRVLPSVLRSLGLVHYRMGNLRDADDAFARALETARNCGDPYAEALALIGQGQVAHRRRDRESAREQYRKALDICVLKHFVQGSANAFIKLAELELDCGRLDAARDAGLKAAEVVDQIDKRGPLHVDISLVESAIALVSGDVATASRLAEEALEHASGSSDRILEADARLALAKARLAAGEARAAEELLTRSAAALRRAGEKYLLAETLRLAGRLHLDSADDHGRLEGMQCLLEARECYRAIGLVADEGDVLLDIANEDIRQRAVDRAAERLAQVRQLRTEFADSVSDASALDQKIADVYRRVEEALTSNAVSARATLAAQHEMGRLLRSDRSFATKLTEFLRVLSRTIPCDGACVLDVADGEGVMVGAAGIEGIAVGERISLPDEFSRDGWPASQAPLVFLGLDAHASRGVERLGRGRSIASALVLPLRERRNGAWSVLYVDRSSMSANAQFHQAEVGHCINLSNQLAGFLEEANIRDRRGLRELDKIDRNIALADIVTESPKMQAILGLVSRVADSDLTVLLQGETGTGKKLLARALHMCSPRANAEFVTVDCASLPENILESELFGHVKGTFTGANADRAGLLERADGGTVFLDEIDKAGNTVQQRFLHLLDCGEIRAVGGREYKKLDIRVVCATSAPDLAAEVEEGRFIKDLYYRLNDINIVVPPLRERREDVPLLCEYFVDVFSQDMGKAVRGFSQFAMKRLIDFEWPGNVRELEKVVRRAVTLADADELIGFDLLPGRLQEEEAPRLPNVALGAPGSLKEKLESIERELVLAALEEHGWNKSRAAVALGLSRKGLKNKIARYGLDRRS